MKAIVERRFYGVVDGEVHPVWHEVGSEVHGELAYSAIAEGHAVPAKKKREPMSVEHQKQSSVSPAAPASRRKTAKGRKPAATN